LIRIVFISLRARRLEVHILIVLLRIACAAAFSRGKVSAGCLFSLARIGFSAAALAAILT
jgi:hypothetical protein